MCSGWNDALDPRFDIVSLSSLSLLNEAYGGGDVRDRYGHPQSVRLPTPASKYPSGCSTCCTILVLRKSG